MKNFIKPLIVIMLIFAVSITVVACNKQKEEVKEQTITINTVEDLQNISNQLGEQYSKTTFVLAKDLDLAGVQWSPIGDSASNAFTGTFNGNGHTISNLTIGDITTSTDGVEDLETVYTALNKDCVGLFGFSKDATFKSVNLNYNYRFSSAYDIAYVGGLVGYAYGNTAFSDITVNGSIDAIYAMKIFHEHENGKPNYANDGYLYVGGVVGSTVGTSIMSVVDSTFDLDITSNDLEDIEDYVINDDGTELPTTFDRYSRFNTVFSGSVAGYMRNVNISASSTETRNTISNVTATYDANVAVDRVHSGAVVGTAYNTDINVVTISSTSKTDIDAKVRAYAGGAVGLLENSKLTTLSSQMEHISVVQSSDGITIPTKKTSYIVGGAVAFMSDNSLVDGANITTDVYTGMEIIQYAGGLVGSMRDSTLTNSTAVGRVYITDPDYNKFNFYDKVSDLNESTRYKFGGAVGKIYGMSDNSEANKSFDISNVDVDFTSYQGIVAEVEDRVFVEETGEDEEGNKTYKNTYFTPSIDSATSTYNPAVVVTHKGDSVNVPSNDIGTAKYSTGY